MPKINKLINNLFTTLLILVGAISVIFTAVMGIVGIGLGIVRVDLTMSIIGVALSISTVLSFIGWNKFINNVKQKPENQGE